MLKRTVLTVAAATAVSLASSLPFQDIARSLIQERQERSTPATALERQMLKEESAPMSRSAASCSFSGTIVDSDGNPRTDIYNVKVYDKYGYVYGWNGIDGQGNFTTSLLPAGTYTFNDGWNALGTLYGNVTKPEDAKWVTLESGHTDLGTVVMDPTENVGSSNKRSVTFTGKVTDPDGNPVKNSSFVVKISPVDGGRYDYESISTTTDIGGYYAKTIEIEDGYSSYYAMLTRYTHTDSNFNAAYPYYINGDHFTTKSPQTISVTGETVTMDISLVAGGTMALSIPAKGIESSRRIMILDSAGAIVRDFNSLSPYLESDSLITAIGVPEGDYRLYYGSQNSSWNWTYHYYPQTSDKASAETISVIADDTVAVRDLRFPIVVDPAVPQDSITVMGTVMDAHGTPVYDARVQVITDAKRNTAYCNKEGAYSVKVAAGSGNITIRTYMDNHEINLVEEEIDTSVSLNSVVTKNFTLSDAGSIGIHFTDTTVESYPALAAHYIGSAVNAEGISYSHWRGGDDQQKWGMHIPQVPAGEYHVSQVPFIWAVSDEFLASPSAGPQATVSETPLTVQNDSITEYTPVVAYAKGVINGTFVTELPETGDEFSMAYCYNSDGTLVGASLLYPIIYPDLWEKFVDRKEELSGSFTVPVTFPFLPAGDYYVTVATPKENGYTAHWYGSDTVATSDVPLEFLYSKENLPRVIPSDAKKITLAKDGIIRDLNFNEAGGSSVIEAGIKEAKIQFSAFQNTIRLAVPAGVIGEGSLKLYSLNGRMIAKKVFTGNGKMVQWNLNAQGVARGTYIAELTAGTVKESFKIAVQ